VAEAAPQSSAETTTAAAEPVEVTKIVVGTGTAFPNVCFIDENGKLTGFDVELLKEIDSRLPEYEFEFQTMDFSNLLLSLETNKIDLVAHVMEKNPERELKYSFNKEPYAHWRNRIVVAKGMIRSRSLDDLKGKEGAWQVQPAHRHRSWRTTTRSMTMHDQHCLSKRCGQ
jgi:L-cystine transport system substrate-binding protein